MLSFIDLQLHTNPCDIFDHRIFVSEFCKESGLNEGVNFGLTFNNKQIHSSLNEVFI